MNTEESKLKCSVAKETHATNCMVKVPMILHSDPKPIHRSNGYHRRLPKPNQASPSNCTNINSPWVMRSAVVFAIVSIIIVFAALQGKTSADLKRTETNVRRLENLVEDLSTNIAKLEFR